MSNSKVAVKVCGWPTSLVAFGAITIAAFTHSLLRVRAVARMPVTGVTVQHEPADRHVVSRSDRRHARSRPR